MGDSGTNLPTGATFNCMHKINISTMFSQQTLLEASKRSTCVDVHNQQAKHASSGERADDPSPT